MLSLQSAGWDVCFFVLSVFVVFFYVWSPLCGFKPCCGLWCWRSQDYTNITTPVRDYPIIRYNIKLFIDLIVIGYTYRICQCWVGAHQSPACAPAPQRSMNTFQKRRKTGISRADVDSDGFPSLHDLLNIGSRLFGYKPMILLLILHICVLWYEFNIIRSSSSPICEKLECCSSTVSVLSFTSRMDAKLPTVTYDNVNVTTLTAANAGLKTKLAAAETQISGLLDQIELTNSTVVINVKAQAESLRVLEKECDDLSAKVLSLQTHYASLTQVNDGSTDQIQELEGAILHLEEENCGLQEKLETAGDSTSYNDLMLTTDRVNALELELKTLQDAIISLQQSKFDVAQGRIGTILDDSSSTISEDKCTKVKCVQNQVKLGFFVENNILLSPMLSTEVTFVENSQVALSSVHKSNARLEEQQKQYQTELETLHRQAAQKVPAAVKDSVTTMSKIAESPLVESKFSVGDSEPPSKSGYITYTSVTSDKAMSMPVPFSSTNSERLDSTVATSTVASYHDHTSVSRSQYVIEVYRAFGDRPTPDRESPNGKLCDEFSKTFPHCNATCGWHQYA